MDFILPIIMMFTILILFAEDLGKKNFEFVNSLPISKFRFLFVRYLRISLLVFIPYTAMLCLFNHYANKKIENKVSFVRLLELTMPTALFLMALALFVIVLTRKLFYSVIICGSYLLFDASSMGNFLNDKTLFISMYVQKFSPKQISDNRVCFFMLTFVLILSAYLIFRSKIYNQILDRLR